MKISAVYKITNTVTNDCYIGSSKNVKDRWTKHKCPSTWKKCPNNPLYQDMQKYGVDKFDFKILVQVEPDQLKEVEQQFIEKLHPTYNNYNAKGRDIEKIKETAKKSQRKYRQSEKGKEYRQSEKYKECMKKSHYKYDNQLCSYNGEILTLDALHSRFRRAGIEHPTQEAKKYLLIK